MSAVNSGYEITEAESTTNGGSCKTKISSKREISSNTTGGIVDNEKKKQNKLKWRIYFSIFFMCWARLISFAGGTAIETTQSSLNSEHGLGTASLAVKTASMIVQSLFFNSICIAKLGIKRSLMVGLGLELVYAVANFYPNWWTLIIGATISGLGKSLHSTTETTYLSKLSRIYVDEVLNTPGASSDVIKTRFINFYFVFYMASRIVGNVISSLILGSGLNSFSLKNLNLNDSRIDEDNYCGANYCDTVINSSSLLTHHQQSSINETAKKVISSSQVYSLVGYTLGSYLLAIVIILLLVVKVEKLHQSSKVSQVDDGKVDLESKMMTRPGLLLLDTIRLWRNVNQWLLLPLSFYNGMDDPFFGADFTKSFVTCPFGIQWVGFTAAWYGITSPLIVLICNGFVKPSLRPIPFFIALGCHLGSGIAMLYLSNFTLTTSFVLSATWGIASGIWPYTLVAFYGVVFESTPEAAFSNYYLCNSVGATVYYSWSYYLCTSIKIYILIGFLSVSIIGYIIVEIRYRRQIAHAGTQNKNNDNTNNDVANATEL